MNLPCKKRPALCEDDSNPFANLSSEGPDGVRFISRFRAFPSFDPKLGDEWDDPTPLVECVEDSQEAADLCASNESVQSPGLTFFWNEEVSETGFCRDGLPFVWVVPAGMFSAFSQEQANDRARAYARRQIHFHIICMSDLPMPCLDQPYNETIFVSSNLGIESIVFVSGSLPPGLAWEVTADNNIRVFGIVTERPDEPFLFTFRAENIEGDFMQKTFSMIVGEFALFDWLQPNLGVEEEGIEATGTFGGCGGVGCATVTWTEGDVVEREYSVVARADLPAINLEDDPNAPVPYRARIRVKSTGGGFEFRFAALAERQVTDETVLVDRILFTLDRLNVVSPRNQEWVIDDLWATAGLGGRDIFLIWKVRASEAAPDASACFELTIEPREGEFPQESGARWL